MQAMQYVRDESLEDLIEPLVRQEGQVNVTYQSPRGWRMLRSNLVAGNADSNLITLQPFVIEENETGTYPDVGDQLTVTFRRGHKKCMFASTVTSIVRGDESATVERRSPRRPRQIIVPPIPSSAVARSNTSNERIGALVPPISPRKSRAIWPRRYSWSARRATPVAMNQAPARQRARPTKRRGLGRVEDMIVGPKDDAYRFAPATARFICSTQSGITRR